MARDVLSRLMGSIDWMALPSSNGKAIPPTEAKTGVMIDPRITFAGPDTGSIRYFRNSMALDPIVTRETAYAVALYAYVAMRWRAENVAEPPLIVVEDTEDGEEEVEGHPLTEILRDPSPDYDMGEIVELTQLSADLYAKALWVKDPNVLGTVGRLTAFAGCDFSVRSTRDRVFGRFDLNTAYGSVQLAPEDVVYFRYLSPYNRLEGQAPVDVALSWLGLGSQVKRTVRSLLENSVFPSVVIQTDPDWSPTPEEFERFKDALDQHHAGENNAGKPLALMGGGKATRVQFSLEDVLPEELLNRVEASVAAAFGIPPVVLGFLVGLQNSPWSQMEQAEQSAYSNSIEPTWARWSKAITRQLLRPMDPNPRRRVTFDTSGVRALQEDESAKIADAATATWWTLDERRAHTGKQPFGDERGEYVELTDAAAAPMEGEDEEEPEDDEPKAETKGRAVKWAQFDLMAKAQESGWYRAVRAALLDQRSRALAVFDEGVKSVKAPPTGDPAKIAAILAALAEKLGLEDWLPEAEGLVDSTKRTALKELAADVGIAFDLLDRGMLEYVEREAAFLVKSIDATTRDRIAAELRAGLAEGESIPKLRKRIEDTWAFSPERAELISRTETTRVTNGAQREALSEYSAAEGVEMEKSWLATNDGRTRDEHRALDDGTWLPIDGTFPNGLKQPGEPNCRCTLTYRIAED